MKPRATYESERHASALLKLALQGDSEIAAGEGLSLVEHRKRMLNVLRSTKP